MTIRGEAGPNRDRPGRWQAPSPARMKLDLFLELATPSDDPRNLDAVLEDTLAVVRAADRLGFDAVWLAEHHFLGDYCNAAAPDLLLAAMARETERIGLGLGVVPLPIHDPVRVAERLATLDLLSGGRVLWGAGRGVTLTELGGFDVDPADTRALFLGRLDRLKSLFLTGEFERGGKHFALRPTPRPGLWPGWMAAVSPESFPLAAELGLSVMAGPFKPWPFVRADLARYRRHAERIGAHPAGTSFTLAAYCEADPQAARARAEAGILWVYRKIFEVSRHLLVARIEGYEHYRNLGRLVPLLDRALSLSLLETLGLATVGSAAQVAERLLALQASGLERVSLMVGGGDLPARRVVDCLILIAEEVVPALERAAAAPGAIAVPA
jgi:alkanesulfonate monooxygenase SsuD/methylene tetrahydromethanopterin reductase-like flavin-dependent oxidoreductase (luciferase family)